MSIIKQILRTYGINPFDALLRKAKSKGLSRFLICWNRGLGDIPLGLYALTYRIRHYVPNAQITFITRSDLKDGFKLLEAVSVIADPTWKRGLPFDLDQTLLNAALSRADFDVILEHPDPTGWLKWQIAKLVPKLQWDSQWDSLCDRFCLDPQKNYIGVHVQTETSYAYEKNWPIDYWKAFFQKAHSEHGIDILLFGFSPQPSFEGTGIIDLRGKTSLFEMLSIIKNHCRYLLVPDSGVLSITYYINATFAIDIVSLWADPKQGVLKQNVASPNLLLRHCPLMAKNKDLRNVSVASALKALFFSTTSENPMDSSREAKKMRDEIHQILHALGQLHLLAGLDRLSLAKLQSFLAQLKKHGPDFPKQQKARSEKPPFPEDVPWSTFERSGNSQNFLRGEELIRQGKVGCLILAGGQGTRLGHEGPKGVVPVTPIRKKSLFQLFCERAKAASSWAGKKLPLCAMTSELNHKQTVDFFERHSFFGLDSAQLSFFQQQTLPFLDNDGHWLLENPGKIAEGPDGNGHALRLFLESGIWEKWKNVGIEYLNVIFVDNPLADPFDPEFVGFTDRMGVDAALKAVERLSPDERMGVLAKREGRLKVIEYSEIPSHSSLFTLSSTGMFCISMDFISRLYAENKAELPLHLAKKRAKVLLKTAKGYSQKSADIWKCERFIFDFLDYARSSAVLLFPREKIYSPLKNAVGDKSIETVKQALLLHDKEVYRALTGLTPAVEEFELDPAFYYPSEAMKKRLQTLCLSNQNYIACDS
jgi:UDP-N-acetylglucosamine/UDP-N-acetylgalactosamine diphosphorylase